MAALLTAVRGDASERVTLEWNPRELGRGTQVAFTAQGGIDGVLWTAIPLVTYSFVQQEIELGALFSLFALTGGLLRSSSAAARTASDAGGGSSPSAWSWQSPLP